MIGRQIILLQRDAGSGDTVETTIPYPVSTTATYTQLDDAMRALNSLSLNTYQDAHVVNTVSLNEELENE